MSLVLVGLSHHHAPIEVRERLSVAERTLPQALASVAACPGVREIVLLSTCNRMEVYALSEGQEASDTAALIRHHLSDFHAVPETVFAPYLYHKEDQEVVAHLLRVTCGLESLVLGEAQILGQVRSALRGSQNAGTVGATLTALFQQALASGKRVQSETALGRGAFSIGHAAVDLASSIFADLSHASILILGAGKMSELTARHLVESGVRFVVVANRTYEKAQRMAERFGGRAIHYDTFPDALVTADIVISSTAAPHPIIHRETLQPVMRRRRGKPLFLIDIAVPRDVDADVARLENVFLKNIDDLQEVVSGEAGERQAEAIRAESIVSDEAAKFLTWYRAREAAPVIQQLQTRLEQIRQDDLTILRAKLGHLSEREWQAIEAATRAMMKKVAREPILRLKRAAGEATEEAGVEIATYDLLSAAKEIFALSEPEPAEYVREGEATILTEGNLDTEAAPALTREPVEAIP